jgi:hypothetical protein
LNGQAATTSAPQAGARIIRGTEVAADVQRDVAQAIKVFKDKGIPGPRLVVILVGDRKDSISYVKAKTKAADSVGIDSQQINLPATTSQVSSPAAPQIPSGADFCCFVSERIARFDSPSER